MRAVVLDIDERLLAERRRLGLDRRDDMWERVVHVVAAAPWPHLVLGSALGDENDAKVPWYLARGAEAVEPARLGARS